METFRKSLLREGKVITVSDDTVILIDHHVTAKHDKLVVERLGLNIKCWKNKLESDTRLSFHSHSTSHPHHRYKITLK